MDVDLGFDNSRKRDRPFFLPPSQPFKRICTSLHDTANAHSTIIPRKRQRPFSLDPKDEPCSKRAFINPMDELELCEGVWQRTLIWILHVNPANLPKNEVRLRHAIKDVCRLRYTVQTDAILFHLAVNNIIAIDNQGHPQSPAFRGNGAVVHVPRRQPPTSLSGFRIMYTGPKGHLWRLSRRSLAGCALGYDQPEL